VVTQDPNLDVALVKIDTKEELELPFFDIAAEAKKPLVTPGTSVLAFGNQFKIADRDEPLSVQRGIVAAYTKLQGRRGIHEASFHGNVYVIDAITNNPGAAGGIITTRKGQLLGLIGKELRNELTNTWINYAIPIQTSMEVLEKEGTKRTVTIAEVVEKREGYKVVSRDRSRKRENNYHGITLVPDPVELTPPFVEEVAPGSPGAKAGLKPDDLIVYVDGEQVGSIKALLDRFGQIAPEATVTLEVRRGDKLTTLKLVMGKPRKK
jgi:serine protease Do